MKRIFTLLFFALFLSNCVFSQVTSSSIYGKVLDDKKEEVIGAVVRVLHVESGSIYGAQTDYEGNYRIVGMRVGGPYTVTITYVGFNKSEQTGIQLSLGEAYELNIDLKEAKTELKEVVVKSDKGNPLNNQKPGTVQQISNEQIKSLPTMGRSLGDITRLVPQGSGNVSIGGSNSSIPSFGGADVRFNNISIDGSVFNNSFGLSPTPGGQTGANFISLDAVEQIQVSLAPYDVRQGGFTGAGVNMVTRSGTNTWKGSVFYNFRNQNLAGQKVSGESLNLNDFSVNQIGFRLGGPIIKDKLFFFVNAEIEKRLDPGTTYRAKTDSLDQGTGVTRVLESDLTKIQSFLIEKYGYNPGSFQDYYLHTFSNKGVLKVDYNISARHKLVFRTNYLYSYRDLPIAASGSFSGRRDNAFAMSFENSNFRQYNHLLSGIVELNSMLKENLANNLKVGLTYNKDYRDNTNIFPLVDILQGGRNYITFGTDPFTPNNKVSTSTFQFSDNLSYYKGKHYFSAGVSFEYFDFKNVFTPYFQGQFAFKSLDDFYKSAAGDTSVVLQRYRQGYSTTGNQIPTANTRSNFSSIYAQDEYTFKKWVLTAGVRIDYSSFAKTAKENIAVTTMNFIDQNGASTQYNTGTLPKPSLLVSPRFGFNYKHSESIRVRGGTGLFTGRPAFVFIGNQVSNNGISQGSIFSNNTNQFPFNSTPSYYTPANPALPSSYSLSLTQNNYRYPQVWRSSLAIDKKINWKELVVSLEGVVTKQINNFRYINANQSALKDSMKFNGPDTRQRYYGSYGLASSDRINAPVTDAIVLVNTKEGFAYTVTFKAEMKPGKLSSVFIAYNFGVAKDLGSAGSVSYNSWASYFTVNGNNNPTLSFSDYDQRHRWVAAISQKINWSQSQSTNITLFAEARNGSRFSYAYAGDMNGDGLFGNDLIYVPKDKSEMNFENYTSGSITYTAAEQADAFDAFIEKDAYLKTRRGMYAERNAAIMPWVNRIDLSISHDVSKQKMGGLQIRLDVFNFAHIFNSNWGVASVPQNTNPLQFMSTDAQGKPVYRMVAVNNSLNYSSFTNSKNISDTWQVQLGVRYTF